MQANIALVVRLAIIVSLGGFLFGYDAAVISGAIGFVAVEFSLTDWQTGFVVAAPTLGGMIALSAGPVSDYLGRKRVLLIIAFLYVLSAITSAFAPNYHVLVIARFIGGLAFASLALAPIYISEIAPSKYRGRMVSINQFNIVIGFSAAYFTNDFFQKISNSNADWIEALAINEHAWRWMLGAETLPAFAYFCLLFLVPESPRWLVIKGRIEEARDVIARLVPVEQVSTQLEEIRNTASESLEPVWERFKQCLHPGMRFALTIGIIIGIAQQITGINAIYFYAPTIFEQSGVGTDAAFTQAIWIGLTNIVFTILAMVLIDKLGRKPLMVAGLTGVFVSMTLCAYGFHKATYEITEASVPSLSQLVDETQLQPLIGQKFSNDVQFKNALKNALEQQQYLANEAALIQAGIHINPVIVLLGILGFVASFAASLGPVMWVLLSEIFPNRLRGVAMSIVGFFNAAVSYGVQVIFPWELSTIGAVWTFLIYGLFAIISLGLVMWLLPETKGKSLEQLEEELTEERRTRPGGNGTGEYEMN